MSDYSKSAGVTICKTTVAADEDEDDVKPIDWPSLSTMLSPDIFAALHGHLIGNESDDSPREPATGPIAAESCIELSSNVKPTPNNAVFKEHSYWEERFTDEEEYDWLLTYEQLQTHLIPLLEVTEKILIVGCGNSRLSACLYDAGFTNITNIDFSDIVIKKMKLLHGEVRPLMKWIFMDMTDLQFEHSSFDVVIDKASMDALMVDEGDVWHPNQLTIDITDRMCLGVSKVLATNKGGRFIQLSFAQPHFRTKYLMGQYINENLDSISIISPFESTVGFCARYQWTLSFSTIDTEAGCLNSFLYVMKS